jgi:hypothetical protein
MTCVCGHEQADHLDGTGSCTYPGLCRCQQYLDPFTAALNESRRLIREHIRKYGLP